LILRDDIPRSLRFCLIQVCATLDKVKNDRSRDALRSASRILSGLQFGHISDIFAAGLHEYLTDFLDSMQDLSRNIQGSFFAATSAE
jgi:uncharacterized alpha-E superfamily protein